MVARKPGRYLAPIALLATAAAVGLLVKGQLATTAPAPVPTVSLGHLSHGMRSPVTKKTAKYYTVKRGDTLSGISVKTHVPIYTLEKLNPGLDPNALQTGQRLKLRR